MKAPPAAVPAGHGRDSETTHVMKALLPIAPATPHGAQRDSASPREATEGDETFASVLDRRNPAPKQSAGKCEAACAGPESKENKVDDQPANEEKEEGATFVPAIPPLLVLPALPYHSGEAPALSLQPMGEGSQPDGDDGESSGGAVGTGDAAAEKPAHSSVEVSAGPGPSLPVLAAMISAPAVPSDARPIAPGNTTPDGTEPRWMNAQPAVAAPPVEPQPSVIAHGPADQVQPMLEPQGDRHLQSANASVARGVTQQGVIADSGVAAEASFVAPVISETREMPLSENTPILDGTPAAKRGEVMPSIAIPAPTKPRAAKSVDEPAPLSEPAGSSLPIESEQDHAPAENRAASPVENADTPRRRAPEQRQAFGLRPEWQEAPAGNRHAVNPELATPGESPERQLAMEPRVEFEPGVSTGVPAFKPQAERIAAEPATLDAPISRAEVVQVVERTLDAALRMRAIGNERVEVAVQLESGERLTIQLRIANGEVTPHFRTNSEGLRTALEQNWSQFSERAGDRGVRLTPPVFDVSQSSSNMTDLSQQRQGRNPSYTDAQAELFPHLPRRMRPARSLAAAPHETAPAAGGVRTYA